MNCLRFVLLLLFLFAPTPTLSSVSAQTSKFDAKLKMRADEFRGPAQADHKKASDKFNSAHDKADKLYDQIVDLNNRYKKVKGLIPKAQQDLIDQNLKTGTDLYNAQAKILALPTKEMPDGGSATKSLNLAKNNLDAGEKSYSKGQWQAAATEFGSCTSNAGAAIQAMDRSLKDMTRVQSSLVVAEFVISAYEK